MKQVITVARIRVFNNPGQAPVFEVDGFFDMKRGEVTGYAGVRIRFAAPDLPQAFVPVAIWEKGKNADGTEKLELGIYPSDFNDAAAMVHISSGHMVEVDVGQTPVRFSQGALTQRDGKTPIVVNTGSGNRVPIFGLEGLDGACLVFTHVGVRPPAALAAGCETVKFSGFKKLDRKVPGTRVPGTALPAAGAPAIPPAGDVPAIPPAGDVPAIPPANG